MPPDPWNIIVYALFFCTILVWLVGAYYLQALFRSRFRRAKGGFLQLFLESSVWFRHEWTEEEGRLLRKMLIAMLIFVGLCGAGILLMNALQVADKA